MSEVQEEKPLVTLTKNRPANQSSQECDANKGIQNKSTNQLSVNAVHTKLVLLKSSGKGIKRFRISEVRN